MFTFAGGVPRVFGDDGNSWFSKELAMNAVPWIPLDPSRPGQSLRTIEYGLLHFQFLNWRSFLLKQYYYKCLERVSNASLELDWITWKYSRTLNEVGITTATSPSDWYAYDDVNVSVLEALAHPSQSHGGWREDQVLQWFEEYGRDHFADLGVLHFDWGAGPQKAEQSSHETKIFAGCTPGGHPALSIVFIGTRNAAYDILVNSLAQQQFDFSSCTIELVVVDEHMAQRQEAIVAVLQVSMCLLALSVFDLP
jgi:hypothetical protein